MKDAMNATRVFVSPSLSHLRKDPGVPQREKGASVSEGALYFVKD